MYVVVTVPPFLQIARATLVSRSSRASPPAMRLIVRFLVLMVAVFGLSVAFAWAWDRSDAPKTTHNA
jgi:hypothetical protein